MLETVPDFIKGWFDKFINSEQGHLDQGGFNALMVYVRNARPISPHVILSFVNAGLNVNFQNGYGTTALMLTACNNKGTYEVYKVMIE